MFPRYQPFTNEWITFGLFFILIVILLGISEIARQKLSWTPSFNRKFVHVLVGILVSVTPFIFDSKLPPTIMGVLFISINWAALKSGNLQGMHTTERKSYGTVYFPFAFVVMTLFWWERPVTLIIALLLLTFADTGAAIVGEKVKYPRLYTIWSEKKSIEGSVAMFLTSFTIVIIMTLFFSWKLHEIPYLPLATIVGLSGLTATFTTIAEAVSNRGSDNFSVPVISAIVYDIYLFGVSHANLGIFLVWIFFSMIMLFFAYRLKSLSLNGAITAFIIGATVFGTGGLKWIMPLLTFFILSSLLSKIGRTKPSNYSKGSQRDLYQVIANGGFATLIAIVAFYQQQELFYILFLGSLAAATADTWATEIGFFSRKNPRHILTLSPVEKGTSGGVSLIGSFGSIIGSLTIALVGAYFGLTSGQVIIVTIAGVSGSIIDSLLGGSFQAIFKCQQCGRSTEKREHCGQYTVHLKGWRWLDNDMVNLINTATGVTLTYFLLLLSVR